jgi:hypothetical protein
MRDMFENNNVRRMDPITSHDAASDNAENRRARQLEDFLRVIKAAGPQGITDHEAHVAVLGIGYSHTSRLNDLRVAGLADTDGERRKPAGKRCEQMVWRATEHLRKAASNE